MRPLILLGHSRSITHIKYNREGDLLFSAAKDHQPNVWFSLNGERLGTYNGHNGTVWSLDVDWTTKKLMTGSGDLTMKLWEVETGDELASITSKSPVRATAFSYSGNMAAYTTDKAMRHNSELFIIDVRCVDSSVSHQDPIFRLPMLESKVTSMVWGPLDETVITGHENGMIYAWDLKTGKELRSTSDHTGAINDMQLSKDGTMFITASKDTSAKLFDADTLTCLKTYRTQKPVNSASISPIMEHVILGGGQDAMEVTTTSAESGKFETRFFHLIYEEEFARLKGHFGPINTLAFHPDGKSYTSGGEDGILRINYFDKTHLEYVFE